jgi:hypothetical protein
VPLRSESRTFGPINGDRPPPYHRLDVRASKLFRVGRGQLEAYLDVFNAYNRKNAEAFDYTVWVNQEGTMRVERSINPLLRIFPTLGVRWQF